MNYKENTMYVRYDDDNDSLDILIDNQRVHVNGHIENGRFLIDSSVLVQYLGIEEENSTHMNEDRYYSEEDAVIAFGLSYIQISKDDKCEYGAFINYSDERFYYEDIFVGDSTSISPSIYNAYIRENSKALTHAHGEEIIERENFSYEDANVAKDLNVNMYLTTPQWCVKKLDSNYEPPKTATWNFIPPKCQIIADNISI